MARKHGAFILGGLLLWLMTLVGCSIDSAEGPIAPASSGMLEKAKIGQLEGIPIGIGATKKEVLEMLGAPIRYGNSEYGFTAYYDGFSLEFEDYADSFDQVSETDKIVLLNADPKTVGLTGNPDEIKGILGAPSREVLDDTGDRTFILEYAEADYVLKLTFDTAERPMKYITLQIK